MHNKEDKWKLRRAPTVVKRQVDQREELVSTLLVQEFDCKLLIFSGVAGGIDPTMEIGEVVVGESLIQYDYGALNEGHEKIFTK